MPVFLFRYQSAYNLKVPYDAVIVSYSVPSSKEICTNNHYVTISSYNLLKVEFKVDETKINSISLGDNATIKISSLNDKEYQGYVTSISNIASNGKFTVVVEFDNDGEVKLGMSANIIIN